VQNAVKIKWWESAEVNAMMKERKKVLCVEDNSVNMLLVSRIVEAEGHELIRAEDGPIALSLLEDLIPDIILLDINLPGINGLELARKFKANDKLRPVPLIATTAQVLVGDREKCLEAGCDDYLPKPLDIKKLRQVLRDHLSNGQ
jgi:two-component system, cell cycle response regulator DivK